MERPQLNNSKYDDRNAAYNQILNEYLTGNGLTIITNMTILFIIIVSILLISVGGVLSISTASQPSILDTGVFILDQRK